MKKANNALSAKNVRIHGMSSLKWTTKDKITQYRGLVHLYVRERDISAANLTLAGKNQQKGMKDLRKGIENLGKELDTAIRGDAQKIKNILVDNRPMRLAYKNSESKNIIENINQLTFNQRKMIDKLKHHIKLKSQQLIDLKLSEAIYIDRLRYTKYNKLPDETKGEIITGKVQDAILRKEAALAINQSYAQIIAVMKKDALYFDKILQTIERDYNCQCKCIINAMKQGNLANHYNLDQQEVCQTLENSVLKDMRVQRAYLYELRDGYNKAKKNLSKLMRKDNDVTTCLIEVDTRDIDVLQVDFQKIKFTLELMANATLVTTFEKIFPSLQDQAKQHVRLSQLLKKLEMEHDIIMNKVDHAETMKNLLNDTMVDTTLDYKKEKAYLLAIIDAEKKRQEKSEQKIKKKKLCIAQLRINLRQYQQISSLLLDTSTYKYPQRQDETNGLKIIEALIPTLRKLKSEHVKIENNQRLHAYTLYETMMLERGIPIEFNKVLKREGVLEDDLMFDNQKIPTREEMKKSSAAFVASFIMDEDQ